MTFKLMPEQIEDAEKMAIASDLPNFSKAGTGKTHTALEAFRRAKMGRGLILCPKIALSMWGEETAFYLGADSQVIRSSKERLTNADFIITTYDLAVPLAGEILESFDGVKATALINDESHYVRSPDAKRTKNLFGQQCDLGDGLAAHFDQVWNLTGTPMVGYANDYFTQAALLHPEIMAKYKAETLDKFERMFTFRKQKQYNQTMKPVWKISGNTNEMILRRAIYTDIGAIRRMEAPGLPELTERTLVVNITLDSATKKALAGVKPEQVLKDINNPESMVAKAWHGIGLAKVSETLEYLDEVSKAGPVLLGIWHRDVSASYYEALKAMGKSVVEVNGNTGDKAKDEIRRLFNLGEYDVLIGQMSAMGVSWNIQQASAHVVIAEEYPSPSVIEQFYKRVYRYGQKNKVQLDFISSNTTIDEALRGVRLRKKASDVKIGG